ncbi:hypothetical protein Hanom_Chr15g01401311 [Helianthus anomalus]
MLTLKFGFFWLFPGKQYRRLSLDSRCATKRAELSGVTHGGTKTRLGLGFELTTLHKALSKSYIAYIHSDMTQMEIELESTLKNQNLLPLSHQ